MRAARSFAVAGVVLLVVGGGLLAIHWGWRKYQRLVSPRAVSIASATRPWSSPAGSLASDQSLPAEPPMPRIRAARELQNPAPPTAASVERGRRVFLDYCASCHGIAGHGDGPIAKNSILPPSDLPAIVGKYSDGYLYATIRYGGAIMPPLGSAIPPAERWDVVNYLRSIATPVEQESAMPDTARTPAPPAPESPAQASDGGPQQLPAGDPARGKDIFEAHCALCHDPTSDVEIVGPGLKGLFQWPSHELSDGTQHASHGVEVIRNQIVEGGGAMAPMGASISEEELADLVSYLQTL